MEVAAQPPAFLLAGGHDLLARALQLAVGEHGLDQGADLGADVLEQPPVAAAERVPVRRPTSRCSVPSRVPPATRSTVTGGRPPGSPTAASERLAVDADATSIAGVRAAGAGATAASGSR